MGYGAQRDDPGSDWWIGNWGKKIDYYVPDASAYKYSSDAGLLGQQRAGAINAGSDVRSKGSSMLDQLGAYARGEKSAARIQGAVALQRAQGQIAAQTASAQRGGFNAAATRGGQNAMSQAGALASGQIAGAAATEQLGAQKAYLSGANDIRGSDIGAQSVGATYAQLRQQEKLTELRSRMAAEQASQNAYYGQTSSDPYAGAKDLAVDAAKAYASYKMGGGSDVRLKQDIEGGEKAGGLVDQYLGNLSDSSRFAAPPVAGQSTDASQASTGANIPSAAVMPLKDKGVQQVSDAENPPYDEVRGEGYKMGPGGISTDKGEKLSGGSGAGAAASMAVASILNRLNASDKKAMAEKNARARRYQAAGDRQYDAIGNLLSDTRAKREVKSAARETDNLLDRLEPITFKYKDPSRPGSAPGQRLGIPAQSVEKSELGSKMVVRDKEGMRMIRPDAGTLMAGLGRLNDRLEAVEGKRVPDRELGQPKIELRGPHTLEQVQELERARPFAPRPRASSVEFRGLHTPEQQREVFRASGWLPQSVPEMNPAQRDYARMSPDDKDIYAHELLDKRRSGEAFMAPDEGTVGQDWPAYEGAREQGDMRQLSEGRRVLQSLNAPTRAALLDELMRMTASGAGRRLGMPQQPDYLSGPAVDWSGGPSSAEARAQVRR